ncbi:hypothetical protein BDZ97DRAFT_312215 [Flammula alnicola]|nr:hypothetical protein BDZ97DRAFT_312215 [Flammula alnicola]
MRHHIYWAIVCISRYCVYSFRKDQIMGGFGSRKRKECFHTEAESVGASIATMRRPKARSKLFVYALPGCPSVNLSESPVPLQVRVSRQQQVSRPQPCRQMLGTSACLLFPRLSTIEYPNAARAPDFKSMIASDYVGHSICGSSEAAVCECVGYGRVMRKL